MAISLEQESGAASRFRFIGQISVNSKRLQFETGKTPKIYSFLVAQVVMKALFM
jgi:hypothetical protein